MNGVLGPREQMHYELFFVSAGFIAPVMPPAYCDVTLLSGLGLFNRGLRGIT